MLCQVSSSARCFDNDDVASRGTREVGRTESYEIYQPKKRKTTELLQKSQIFTVLQKFWFQIGETQVFVILSSFWDLNHQQFSEINGSFWGGTLHRACTLINCPKQHNNTLNVSKITKIQALDGRFSTNARLDGRARLYGWLRHTAFYACVKLSEAVNPRALFTSTWSMDLQQTPRCGSTFWDDRISGLPYVIL